MYNKYLSYNIVHTSKNCSIVAPWSFCLLNYSAVSVGRCNMYKTLVSKSAQCPKIRKNSVITKSVRDLVHMSCWVSKAKIKVFDFFLLLPTTSPFEKMIYALALRETVRFFSDFRAIAQWTNIEYRTSNIRCGMESLSKEFFSAKVESNDDVMVVSILVNDKRAFCIHRWGCCFRGWRPASTLLYCSAIATPGWLWTTRIIICSGAIHRNGSGYFLSALSPSLHFFTHSSDMSSFF